MLKKVGEALRDFRSAASYLSAHVPTRAEIEDASDMPSSSRQAYASRGASDDEFEDELKRAVKENNPRNIKRAAFGLLHDIGAARKLEEEQCKVILHTTARTTVGECRRIR